MQCPYCKAKLTAADTCEKCGSDVRQFKKLYRLSNRCYNEGLQKAKGRDLSGAVVELQNSLKINKKNNEKYLVVSIKVRYFAPRLDNELKSDKMAQVCELTGKKAMGGNNVSHAMNKTKRKFKANLTTKRFYIPEEDRWITLRVSTSAIKTINKKGISAVLKEAKEKGFIK